MLHSLDMPSFGADESNHAAFVNSGLPFNHSPTPSQDQPPGLGDPITEKLVNGDISDPRNGGVANGNPPKPLKASPNGRALEPGGQLDISLSQHHNPERSVMTPSQGVEAGADRTTFDPLKGPFKPIGTDDGVYAATETGQTKKRLTSTHMHLDTSLTMDGSYESRPSGGKPYGAPAHEQLVPNAKPGSSDRGSAPVVDTTLRVPTSAHRVSSPPAFPYSTPSAPGTASTSSTMQQPGGRLQHRHTLEVPKVSGSRTSRDSDDVITATGRSSPIAPARRTGSMTITRRPTRSTHSELHLDEVPQDDDAARWAEHIRQKRASKRKRKEDEDDDRVVVGTKVDQNHVNWVTAYNMLTGIRFTVSRTNAKMDRDLTDADFVAKHKFSFDITGNELTPSAKYDFKFKDYAPWVFRHLRSIFRIDPADYLMSLTSKYILSELGSPGKSGSFFYFSRDYKYIIKTIHHAEHKFLRRILKDYYNHVQENPNTLLSQFYGLHRVKIPYGRKVHFVVMNNLFPPHRDIHTTFDLKGSTVGRDFQEDDLEKNPRATLKDLNWLRRNLHLEFGPTKKTAFIEQMERDVKLLQRLKIMDYSLLIGIHDLERGNEDNLRDKTLKVFQPGGEDAEDPMQANMLMRTPSKLENARKAKELRQIIKHQRPIPMDQTANKMPDEVRDERKHFYFYSDDGGFRATHEDDNPGEEIYYLGIIDCLTHYNLIKRTEHFFKGLTNPESQISAIPPERYGDRFVRFISGVTKTRERAEMEKAEQQNQQGLDDSHPSGVNIHRTPADAVVERAEREAERSRRWGAPEENVPDRSLGAVRSPSGERGEIGHTLPVVEEATESGSMGGRSGTSSGHRELSPQPQRPPPTPPKDDRRPATPPKDDFRRRGPPTPPKDDREKGRNKDLPPPPTMTDGYAKGSAFVNPVNIEELGMRVQSVN